MKINAYIVLVLLSCLVLFNSTKASLTYAYYEIDPIGFIDNLCENNDKPELECNGKCHLKKVAESQDSKQNTPESIIDFKELILFSSSMESIVFKKIEYIKKQNSTVYQNLYSFTNSYYCFQPPKA